MTKEEFIDKWHYPSSKLVMLKELDALLEAERERCAKEAEAHNDDYRHCDKIAKRIRSLK